VSVAEPLHHASRDVGAMGPDPEKLTRIATFVAARARLAAPCRAAPQILRPRRLCPKPALAARKSGQLPVVR
jgi:hypothetical protein